MGLRRHRYRQLDVVATLNQLQKNTQESSKRCLSLNTHESNTLVHAL
jgi:hypothetical protein